MGLNIVIFGLSMTSSWGNGHATTYRALAKALARRGHKLAFVERDVEWYRAHRDMPESPYADIRLYETLEHGLASSEALVRNADLAILGSFVQDGADIADWLTREAGGITAFYDIDTPVTLAALADERCSYLSRANIPQFDLYLSFTGGPTLRRVEKDYGARKARPLYCAVDPEIHAPVAIAKRWELGYLGTFSNDRQPKVREYLLETARRFPDKAFVIGGPQYPDVATWPANVAHRPHIPPPDHAAFYCAQRYTLNVTRSDMGLAGFSPSVRLFEAAACGVPIISDAWPGLETILTPGEDVFVVQDSDDVCAILCNVSRERQSAVGAAGRRRVLQSHTADHRALELELYYREGLEARHARAGAVTYA